jgi:hypothetical protein
LTTRHVIGGHVSEMSASLSYGVDTAYYPMCVCPLPVSRSL